MNKLVLLLVVLFIGFYLFTQPDGLAEAVADGLGRLWELLTRLFEALIKFLNALTS
ncbi:MAG: hypothetical protein Q8Q02_15530 [Nocardioides sp.]|nr:hypothetical protein [Nocardioides sp.]